MIAALALAVLVYGDVPPEVVRVSVLRWRPGNTPEPIVTVARDRSRVSVAVPAATTAIALFERRDGSYLLDGPFVVSSDAAERRVDGAWRRTVQGRMAGESSSVTAIEWLSANEGVQEQWPACSQTTTAEWMCIGVPVGATGVVIAVDGARLWSAPVRRASVSPMTASSWGRLLLVHDRGPDAPPKVHVMAARAVTPQRRSASVRLDTVVLSDLRIWPMHATAFWVAGDSSPPDGWVEVRSARSAPAYLPLADLVDGSPRLPVHLTLDEPRAVDVAIVSDRAEPVGAALVTTFRLVDSMTASAARQRPPRRVFTSEAAADGNGRLTIEGLGDAVYEVVAWHPRFGRGSLLLPAGADRVTIHLRSPGIARGRVLAGGKPVSGVDVTVAPDPAALIAAEDPIDLKGGDARTAADGRFVVALAPGGGGELRVGGGKFPTRRIPLPSASLPLVELGDIDLGGGIPVSIALDQDPGCDVRAAGPIGRAGLNIVTATRAGPGLFTMTLPEEGSWEFTLLCGRDERALSPAVVRISNQTPPGLAFGVR